MDRPLPVDSFRQATASTTRAIAGQADLAVSFTEGNAGYFDTEIRLPLPPLDLAYQRVTQVRGEADGIALWLRHHDRSVHARYSPGSTVARAAFDVLETVRVESLGCQHRSGISQNLAARRQAYCRTQGYDRVAERGDGQFADVLGLLLRELIAGQMPPDAARVMVDLWRPLLQPQLQAAAKDLKASLADQSRFAQQVQALLAQLGLPEEDMEHDLLLVESSKMNPAMLTPQIAGVDADDEGAQVQPHEELADAADLASESAAAGKIPEEPAVFSSTQDTAEFPYTVYTTAFDEIVQARDLSDAEELARLRRRLDDRLTEFVRVIGPLANRLQRKLLARQRFSWAVDLEEGELNTARLAQLVASPLNTQPFMEMIEADYRDTTVTLLIDNSGSMRGRPITVAAMSADILARTLERCAVKVEILGFTTGDWKGGKARQQWLTGRSPAGPGRLNSLRHIIYKDAAEPWRRARNNLGLMLRESLLKENIDGEAILWAHQRLLQRPEQRRILMVISDGAPVDDSTLSANHGKYLEQHLQSVVDWIETKSSVELLAIGIGHDVRHYYQRAITINDVEQLGSSIINQLSVLFDMQGTSK